MYNIFLATLHIFGTRYSISFYDAFRKMKVNEAQGRNLL